MLLTKRMLNTILRNHRVQIPIKMEKELLQQYGQSAATEEGLIPEYSEQDICEQLRKILSPNENDGKEVTTLG